VRCADLAGRADFGRCEPGARVAAVFDNLVGPTDEVKDMVWPTADFDPDQLSALKPYSLVVGTDGSAAAIEGARTILIRAYPDAFSFPDTEAEWEADFARTLTGWKQLADVIVVSSMVLAGCSLAVSVVGGLTDRKRPFSMLRLTGVQLGALRRVVALETAVPLLSAAVVAVAVGLLTAHLFLVAQMHYALRPPSLSFAAIVVAGLLASLGIVGSTFPLLRRITGPDTARNE
jgi:predicted lysophospholipase L1 biosynthesis ABC-type transport system permease subunit